MEKKWIGGIYGGEIRDWERKSVEGIWALKETEMREKVNEWEGRQDFDGVSAPSKMGVFGILFDLCFGQLLF